MFIYVQINDNLLKKIFRFIHNFFCRISKKAAVSLLPNGWQQKSGRLLRKFVKKLCRAWLFLRFDVHQRYFYIHDFQYVLSHSIQQ